MLGKLKTNQAHKILDFAINNKITTVDTAKNYGNSETIIGEFLKKNKVNNIKIITKVCNGNPSFLEQIKDSILKFGDFPYAVLAHSKKIFLDKDFQISLKKFQGKFRSGVSVYNLNEIKQIMDSPFKPDIIQVPINILDTRLFRSGILEIMFKNKIDIHARSVFLQGFFYLSEDYIKNKFPDAISSIERLKRIGKEYNLTIAELSLLWVANLKYISKVVLGVDSINHLLNHINSLRKSVNPHAFEKAIALEYDNEFVLNPSKW